MKRRAATLCRLENLVIGTVVLYKVHLSPKLARFCCCRFHPTCSTYFIKAVRKCGLAKGSALGLWRIARCNPFSKGGIDRID